MRVAEVTETLAAIEGFCGVGRCTGVDVVIPLVMNPDGERMALSVTVACCIFCEADVAAAFPGATVRY